MDNKANFSHQLKMLDFYLTFIHFFGFSINPSDDLQSRYLSIKVRRAIVAAAAAQPRGGGSGAGEHERDSKQQTEEEEEQEPGQLARHCRLANLSWRAASAAKLMANQVDLAKLSSGEKKSRLKALFAAPRLKLALKFYAIALTTFLATNHVIVLCDYIYQGSKVFMELLLELRLVLTKFSALIFVFAWHQNQAKVRQLVRLIESTSVHILANEDSDCASEEPPARPRAKSQETVRRLNRVVANWWLMCVCITIIHFGLSEAEIRTAQHLWTWLDDYSLHQLSNETTSTKTLFIMASFDNYIYTVHVYGTRLIGASIICIVCTFQIESIKCLRRRAHSLLRPSRRSCSPSAAPNQWPLTAAHTKGAPPLDRHSFFVLGESDWLEVESNGLESHQRAKSIGWLSSPLGSLTVGCGQLVLRWANCLVWQSRERPLPEPCLSPSDQSAACQRELWWPLSVHGGRRIVGRVTPTRKAANVAEPTKWTSRPLCGSTYASEMIGRVGPTPKSFGCSHHGSSEDHGRKFEAQLEGRKRERRRLGLKLEAQLEQLARKYELIRTVNQRVDNCFGQMLLSQYSFLFLMSCIDVVYFSLSFNPNTKTKYIIISGMILLWWPYLLLYKFASDVGSVSKGLLVSVRRLARLALVLQLEELEAPDWIKSGDHSLNSMKDDKCAPQDANLDSVRSPGRQQFSYLSLDQHWSFAASSLLASERWRSTRLPPDSLPGACGEQDKQEAASKRKGARARIFNKLDHVFKPSHLSIVGLMTVDKFFLLNFAKIVITASVMTIQFITK